MESKNQYYRFKEPHLVHLCLHGRSAVRCAIDLPLLYDISRYLKISISIIKVNNILL